MPPATGYTDSTRITIAQTLACKNLLNYPFTKAEPAADHLKAIKSVRVKSKRTDSVLTSEA